MLQLQPISNLIYYMEARCTNDSIPEPSIKYGHRSTPHHDLTRSKSSSQPNTLSRAASPLHIVTILPSAHHTQSLPPFHSSPQNNSIRSSAVLKTRINTISRYAPFTRPPFLYSHLFCRAHAHAPSPSRDCSYFLLLTRTDLTVTTSPGRIRFCTLLRSSLLDSRHSFL